MRHVFATMGTVASLDAAGPATETAAETVAEIERLFDDTDRRFSRFRDDSELSAVNAGRLRLMDATPELREAYELANDWRLSTGGAFTPLRPDGRLDLDGVVKALTMSGAAALLDAAPDAAAAADWTLVVGGDMVTSGAGEARPTGIVDPADRGRLLGAIELRGGRRAIATSGSAERGDHIWKAGTVTDGTGSFAFSQVTVVADDIVTADVLATAIVAGGEHMLLEACERWDIDVLAVEVGGGLRATPGLRNALAAA